MAKETITKLIDDLDGGEAEETVKFGLDGQLFEIDLSAKNASRLRSALAPYLEVGARVATYPSLALGRSANGRVRGATVPERDQNKAIRSWAQRRGIDVAPRGRIRADIIDQYHREAGR